MQMTFICVFSIFRGLFIQSCFLFSSFPIWQIILPSPRCPLIVRLVKVISFEGKMSARSYGISRYNNKSGLQLLFIILFSRYVVTVDNFLIYIHVFEVFVYFMVLLMLTPSTSSCHLLFFFPPILLLFFLSS